MDRKTIMMVMIAAGAVALDSGCNRGATPQETTTPSAVAKAPPPPPPAAPPPAPFEGEVQMVVKEKGKTVETAVYEIKGGKLWTTVTPAGAKEPASAAVADLDAKKAWLVADAKRTYSPLDVGKGIDSKVQISKTGRSEIVAGRSCEDWRVTDGKERFQVCAAKGIPFFAASKDPKAAEPAWAAAMTRERAFPLHVVGLDGQGKEEFIIETAKLQARRVDDTKLAVPGGYRAVASKEVKLGAALP